MIRFFSAAIVALFLASPATAQTCTPVDQVTALLDAQGVRYSVLDGPHTLRAAALADEATGSEPSGWTVVLIAVGPDGEAFMLLGREGAICTRLNLPFEAVKDVLRRVYGWRV
jgi:hypothetical protein